MSENEESPKEDVKTPEVDPREASAVKMLITHYPDTQEIRVQNVQNLTRPLAMYMSGRVLKTYEDDETALSVVKHLSSLVEQSKKSGEKLWVPGGKK
jgi:hypothetical protein